jgi:PLP dependent protein
VSSVEQNLQMVQKRIAAAATACGRRPEEIMLLAISKTFPVETIAQAVAAGQYRFGENRVQEAEAKIPQLRAAPGLEWHLVGHLQSNKANRAAQLFDVIHSVDSVKIASRLNQECLKLGKRLSVLLQVDLGHEASKFGADATGLFEIVDAVLSLPALRLDGLMTIPPFFEDPELARPFFAELCRLKDSLEARNPGCLGIRHLSMGMSHDFEVAIQEQATIVRVGTAVFGDRSRG